MCTRTSYEDCSMVIADNLRNERMKRNWSQQFVADQTGLSTRTISRCENGNGISSYTLKALCKLYGIELMDAYRTESNPEVSFGANTISPTRIMSILANSRIIHDLQKEIVLNLLQEMKTESFISREQMKNIIYGNTGKKNSYSFEDMEKCCQEVNSLTTVQMMNVIKR